MMMDTTVQPKILKRPAGERGYADHGWLQARFTFSFGDYMNPDHMRFHTLRVMNNDTIQPGGGFPMHPHANMEIFTYVIEGQLEHRDSMGNGAVLAPGNLQYLSAGEGIRHSEFNPSQTEKTFLYQIWILPQEKGGQPHYQEKPLSGTAKIDDLSLLYSGDGRDGSTRIRQDADIYFGQTNSADGVEIRKTITVPVAESTPHAWIQVISGELTVLGEDLTASDGLAIEDAPEGFEITATNNSHFLLFRLSSTNSQ